MSIHSLVIAIASGLFASFSAQTCDAQKTDAQASLSFVSFPKSIDPVRIKLAIAENRTIDIEATSNWVSKPVRVSAMGIWAVGREERNPEGKTVFKELGRAKSAGTSSQILILIRKGNDDAAGFDVIPLDTCEDQFRGGHFLFMNAARIDIGGVLGDRTFAIKPGKHSIVKPVDTTGARNFRVVLSYRQNEQTVPFSSTVWPISKDARSLIFFYHDPTNQNLRADAHHSRLPGTMKRASPCCK
jgi:hypothetical protein